MKILTPQSKEFLDDVIVHLIYKIRQHPHVISGPSVRGTTSLRLLLHARGRLKNDVTSEDLLDCALIALPHRMVALRDPSSIVTEIISGREPKFDKSVILADLKNMAIPKVVDFDFWHQGSKKKARVVRASNLLLELLDLVDRENILLFSFNSDMDIQTRQFIEWLIDVGVVSKTENEIIIKKSFFLNLSNFLPSRFKLSDLLGERGYPVNYRGNPFREISVRHTLRKLASLKKKTSDMEKKHLIVRPRSEDKKDIILCMDNSHSMSGKMLLAKAIALNLIKTRGRHQLGIVAFGNRGYLILEPTHDEGALVDEVIRIGTFGKTNMLDGLKASRKALKGDNKHIILISDGCSNIGSEEELLQMTREIAMATRISTICIGDSNLMKEIARMGRGRYHNIDPNTLRNK
ncbi:MAG: VWA domain-containing protein [Methanocellales archaeon]|nr:VWA domain-containing protein [Methanocellales archaeon]MDD3291233.1 VWA domain-containing protein [Methanocellales archaeon]MDD5235405.1 VWA domain-containing protein [Methanocellales archaeon]MDD5484512.1 VWA domain-containing protein [Methanocellales archaeon]